MKLRFWIGVAVSAALLWYSMGNVDFLEAWRAAQQMNTLLLAPYLVLILGEVVLRAWRWQMLLAPIKHCSISSLTTSMIIGLMANNVLPARAGEFLRAWVGGRMEHIPYSTCLATVVIDRVFDGLTASAIFLAVVLAYPLPEIAKVSGYAAGVLYLATLAGLVGLITKRDATLRLVATLMRALPHRFTDPAQLWLGSFASGLGVFRDARLLTGALTLSFVIWFGYGVSLYLIWLAFDIRLAPADAFVVLMMLTIGLTLPSTPGFVGAMEAAVVTGLLFFGIDKSVAFAVAIVYHVTQYVPITLWGLLALWTTKIGFGQITQPIREDEPLA